MYLTFERTNKKPARAFLIGSAVICYIFINQ